ncbi:MAG: hypothetical protein M4579_002662 [Chaenotheca gracillima]|nr:MAG: hypothetical protein M4579_002662 [Chaenotheca gracillima]
MDLPPDHLDFIINHLVLPPQLPQEDDSDDDEKRNCLLKLVLDTACSYGNLLDEGYHRQWADVKSLLSALVKIQRGNEVDQEALCRSLATLKPGDTLALHVTAQNAGLIIRAFEDVVRFESFEASPSAAAVMASPSNLLWSFPGRAVEVANETFKSSAFQQELAAFLNRLSTERIAEAMPTSSKAGNDVIEERESADPMFISGLLMNALVPHGTIVSDPTTIQKSIRDDVCWDDSKLPWKRCGLWLVLRVALQSTLASTSSGDKEHVQYKNFMVYLMSRVSKIALSKSASHESLYVLNAKVARRCFKLGTRTHKLVAEEVLKTARELRGVLKQRWLVIRKEDDGRRIPEITIEASNDTHLSLSNSNQYLLNALQQDHQTTNAHEFSPECPVRIKIGQYGLPTPTLGDFSGPDCHFALAAFEGWVEVSLPNWNSAHVQSGVACKTLFTILEDYFHVADSTYDQKPEQISVMLLTILELWRAIDQIVTRTHPLLREFAPEIPTTFLEPLLLPRIAQLNRLHLLEQYLSKRWSDADSRKSSLFSDPTKDSFAVQFYESSNDLRTLRRQIEKDAGEQKSKKEAELVSLTANFNALTNEIGSLECTLVENADGDFVHSYSCRKCNLRRQLYAIGIAIFEWPLPRIEHQCRCAIFELRCPLEISVWRDATYLIVQVLGGTLRGRGSPPPVQLFTYQCLQPYSRNQNSRLVFASDTKSFHGSHYKIQRMPVRNQDVCYNNGLQYHLFDRKDNTWVTNQFQSESPSIKRKCDAACPDGPYKNLERYVNSTSHTSNEVIAGQNECSKEITLEEYHAFASLRSGERLQWLNILRELASTNLSFKTVAVRTLVLQATLQAGPSSNDSWRSSHNLFKTETFPARLLLEIELQMQNIEANWKELNYLAILVDLILRTLSLTVAPSVIEKSLVLLLYARKVSLKWTRDLLLVSQEAMDDSQIKISQHRVLEAACLCRNTFNVDPEYRQGVLSEDEHVANYLECSTYVHDNSLTGMYALPHNLRQRLCQDRRLSHDLEDSVLRLIQERRFGLDRAIQEVWPAFTVGARWSSLQVPNGRWLSTTTSNEGGQTLQTIHFNILEGQLLVDGHPLGRLPTNYVCHPTYHRVLRTRILRVSKADMPDMVYMTAQPFEGYQVYFGMRDAELIIRTKRNRETMELIPYKFFKGDLPTIFVEDHTHWLNLGLRDIEIRPLDKPWTPSRENWRIRVPQGESPTMYLGKRKMLDIRNERSNQIAAALRSVEVKEFLHISKLSDRGRTEIELPRLNLRFYVDKCGCLESPELLAVVDPDQSIGALYGLESRLVLRDSGPTMGDTHPRRSVIVPLGAVSSTKIGSNHPQTRITPMSPREVRWFRYDVDITLGRLGGAWDALGSLYKAYLHAVTAYILPDPLTGRTGTEESLSCLRKASLSPVFPWEEDAIDLLTKISRLTPKRVYYPKDLRKMQQIGWKAQLSYLVQHEDFHILASQLLSQGQRIIALYEDMKATELEDRGAQDLLDKARLRNAFCRNTEFGWDLPSTPKSHVYFPRDRLPLTQAETRVQEIVALIKEWPARLNVTGNLTQLLRSYGRIGGYKHEFEFATYSELLRLNFGEHWGSLYNLCRGSTQDKDSHRLAFMFSIIVFGKIDSLIPIRTLLGFALLKDFHALNAPPYDSYDLRMPSEPKPAEIRQLISGCVDRAFTRKIRKRLPFQADVAAQTELIVQSVRDQWPTASPCLPTIPNSKIPLPSATQCIQEQFRNCFQNKEFLGHLVKVQSLLDEIDNQAVDFEHFNFPSSPSEGPVLISGPRKVHLDLTQLLSEIEAPLPSVLPEALVMKREDVSASKEEQHPELEAMIAGLISSGNKTRSKYGCDLSESLKALHGSSRYFTPRRLIFDEKKLIDEYRRWSQILRSTQVRINKALEPVSQDAAGIAKLGGLWPRTTRTAILELLASVRIEQLNAPWRKVILDYGRMIAQFQRSGRMLLAAANNDASAFFKEAENPGHAGWEVDVYPDWLLMELDCNFLIRETQAKVAFEMISPSSKGNAVMQLNMGEGKSSVIIPMVAAALANGTNLTRVIVLKPLLKQMAQILSQKLGGLVQRQIHLTPFSRKTPLETGALSTIRTIHEECRDHRGILLAQPETLLSFQLIGYERLSNGDLILADSLLSHQNWLKQTSRDILDESDEILDTRFQLIYTIGTPRPLEGGSSRWIVTQKVLDLVSKRAMMLWETLRGKVDLEHERSESFPSCRFLERDASEILINAILGDVAEGAIPGLNFNHCPNAIKIAVLRVIQHAEPARTDVDAVREHFWDTNVQTTILLLRGLIAHRVLSFALESKRWLVNYGQDPKRCMMAVPFRAKGVPAQAAEFGHADVAIVLTCLSYYYDGLTDSQLRQCFELLESADDPTLEFESWEKAAEGLPKHLRRLNGVNLEDENLCVDELFPHMRLNKAVIDFFLSRIVFPKEGKEFIEKLSTSGWDIPSENQGSSLTTGFSGTNDNRYLLPLSISQQDMRELQMTSARVLGNVLRKENRHYICARDPETGQRLQIADMIRLMARQSPPVRVLLDVGAQILELGNRDVGSKWLELVPDAEAAVYFDEEDEVVALGRDGRSERLRASPFRDRLGRCLIYLDDVHTRGTDLQIPPNTRAAVTLGPSLTKDRLVQACMRMRKLGDGHSVMFIGPPEVHQSILEVVGKSKSDRIDGCDVVRWSLQQTCRNIENNKPLWYIQGWNHRHRQLAATRFRKSVEQSGDLSNESEVVEKLLWVLREPEARSLEKLYGFEEPENQAHEETYQSLSPIISDPILEQLHNVRRTLNAGALRNSSVQEEQEREIAHEVELERQVQRPNSVKPLVHRVDKEVHQFVAHGFLPAQKSEVIIPASKLFSRTSAWAEAQDCAWSKNLVVSADFMKTVDLLETASMDDYLRPVKWILSGRTQGNARTWLIVSPFEVNALLPQISTSKKVILHIYAPKVAKAMCSFSSMKFFTLPTAPPTWTAPPDLQRRLSLLAGNVYFETFKEYRELCHFLGLGTVGNAAERESNVEVRSDGFVPISSRGNIWVGDMVPSPFSTSPLLFFQIVGNLRRRGQNFHDTHMGQILKSRALSHDAFVSQE